MATRNENPDMEKSGVRFAAQHEEIPPHESLAPEETMTGSDRKRSDLGPSDEEELQQLKTTLQNNINIQSSRMQHHAFEPVSLPGSQPVSRVPSGTNTPMRRVAMSAGSGHSSMKPSPHPSPPTSAVHSPPLTPAVTHSKDGKPFNPAAVRPTPNIMTPQRSTSPLIDGKTSQPTSQTSDVISSHPKQAPRFSLGPAGDSQPPSGEASPGATPASTAPGSPRPFTPSDGTNEPAHRAKSDPNARYRFGDRDPAIGFTNSGQANATLPSLDRPQLPHSVSSSNQKSDEKRSSFFSSKKHDESSTSLNEKTHSHSSSKSNLKRFFKIGDHKHKDKEKEKDKEKRHSSSASVSKDDTKTPPGSLGSAKAPSVPFADDHGLESKYGKFGKMLGSGAGGSVRLMKRTGDGTVFAVKQFRDRHAYESEREYNKKVTAEFCIGSTLHHGNVIETIDIVHEKGRWFEVMEYAPFDLFATVMTGKMGRDEISCSTLQILSGVLYLHSMGLAHRDLKLDNVVINDRGIMKLIDFGSAVVFRYPFEQDVVLATGVVGSDPYLAPEVYDQTRYDPRPTDIWSIAIIFCCMTLRRFPWKAPRISDNSYRLFVAQPDPDQEKWLSASAQKRSLTAQTANGGTNGAKSEPTSRNPSTSEGNGEQQHHHHHHHHHQDEEKTSKSEPVSRTSTHTDPNAQPTIKGPVRLLRLLPRETRHIIGRMLELDPKKRADMDEILADPWVHNSLVCRQEENGVIIKAPNHTHTLQPSNGGK
ncbi:Serine/threonine-protein kinase oca2 [Acrodontium crateriforme]|uniref:non-specific serine/threonine protein kinase n=1 Tax=Acrodontium crateriforme TaxID=150365 RepID=A0AAQ3RCP9_9PEZI|nr:Serine/threonine-protein kinase oca2 [Acrodontium crateriforme]